jgi:hypothetical protein
MSRSLSVRRAAVSALLVAALLAALVPSMAGAATPKAGYFSGATSQADVADPGDPAEAGSVGFKVFKYGSFSGTVRKVSSVSVKSRLTCANGEVKQDRYLVVVPNEVVQPGCRGLVAEGAVSAFEVVVV